MNLKPGASIAKLTPRMAFAAVCVQGVFEAHGYPCIVTSGDDRVGEPGGHKTPEQGGKHGLGDALDFRSRHVPITIMDDIVDGCRQSLGPAFDVIPERDHLHVEYDPKP